MASGLASYNWSKGKSVGLTVVQTNFEQPNSFCGAKKSSRRFGKSATNLDRNCRTYSKHRASFFESEA